jgi:hypothetical protein
VVEFDAAAAAPVDDGQIQGLDPDAAPPDTTSTGSVAEALDASSAVDENAVAPDASDATSDAVTLCTRLDNPLRPAGIAQLSLLVEQAYVRLVYSDCDVGAMISTNGDTLFDFQNALVAWNLQLWGCDGQSTTQLGLLRDGFVGVTSADVARLSDHYVAAASQVLAMSAEEELAMRDTLSRLTATAILVASDAFSLSVCAADAADGGGS